MVSCKYCKKSGHTIDQCYKLHGFPSDFKFSKGKRTAACVQLDQSSDSSSVSPSTAAGSSHAFSPEQYAHLLSLFQQIQPSSQAQPSSSQQAFTGLAHSSVFNTDGSFACNASQLDSISWILDSGATNHMTP